MRLRVYRAECARTLGLLISKQLELRGLTPWLWRQIATLIWGLEDDGPQASVF